ncbi:MAG: hypothetical protein GY711_32735 [bacterium]|nr:hypothetical protein [bacterium]
MPDPPSAELDLEAEARMDGLDESELERLEQAGPDPDAPPVSDRPPRALFFIAMAMSAFLFHLHGKGDLPGPPLGIVMVACFVGVPLVLFFRASRRGRARRRAPVENHKAVVMASGTEDVDPVNSGRPQRTTVVLRLKRGGWRRVRASRSLADQLQRGDRGVAFLRANTLIDFKRLT